MVLAGAGAHPCAPPKPAEISVVPSASEVEIDTSRDRDALQAENVDTINPYGYEKKTHVNGFMDGRIELKHTAKLGYRKDPGTGGLCLWYDAIEIQIVIDPKIVIASEVADDQCKYQATLEHEMKHVKADRRIVNKYAQTIGQKVYDGLGQRGFFIGPVSAEHAEEAAGRMHKTIGQLLELEYKKMDIERREVQQEIDSLEEYNRVAALCPER